jgi:hypothetical protein
MPEEIIGVRDRIKLYAEECQKKKDIENREKFAAQKLDASITDVTRFDSPSKPTNCIAPTSIGKANRPAAFQFSPEDDPLEPTKKMRKEKTHMKSLHPFMMSGTAIDHQDNNDDDGDAVSNPVNSMRPGMTRGTSFGSDSDGDSDSDTPGITRLFERVEKAEETKAKLNLVELLCRILSRVRGRQISSNHFHRSEMGTLIPLTICDHSRSRFWYKLKRNARKKPKR